MSGNYLHCKHLPKFGHKVVSRVAYKGRNKAKIMRMWYNRIIK